MIAEREVQERTTSHVASLEADARSVAAPGSRPLLIATRTRRLASPTSEVDDHDRHRHEREGRGQRHVPDDADLREHLLTEVELELPKIVGRMKSPSVSENVKIEPATRPGFASGSTTLRNVSHGRAPRSLEASRNDPGTRSSAASTGRIMNGSQR